MVSVHYMERVKKGQKEAHMEIIRRLFSFENQRMGDFGVQNEE